MSVKFSRSSFVFVCLGVIRCELMDGRVEKAAEQLEFFYVSLGGSAVCLIPTLNLCYYHLVAMTLKAILNFIKPFYDLKAHYLVSPR